MGKIEDKLLTVEEERNLGKIIKESVNPLEVKQAIDTLVERNIRLVRNIAIRYHSTELSPEDLEGEGYIGLMDAVKTFDYAKRYRFSTHATPIIKHRIIDALRRTKSISKTDDEGQKERHRLDSLDTPLYEEEEKTPHDVIRDESKKPPIENLIKEEEREQLINTLTMLKPKEREVLVGKRKGSSDKKIAEKLRISTERVKQLRRKGIRKVQCLTRGEDLRGEVEKAGILDLVILALEESGVLPFEESTVKERIGDKALVELVTNIEKEEELVKNNEDWTESQKEDELMFLRGLKLMFQKSYNGVKELKMRGDHIFFPPKTKPRRENVFKAATYLMAIFNETFGTPRWDLIERIISAYCPEVFRGGNIESWYRNLEKKSFNIKEMEKFKGAPRYNRDKMGQYLLDNLKKELQRRSEVRRENGRTESPPG
jgi:RNA polymerase sigma factor (sigma-70 family)